MACVLIVDDNPIIRRLVREQLQAAGVENCVEAVDGVDAIEQAKQIDPDVAVIDVAMPRLNGIDATRELRKLHHPNLAVILHTLHADVLRAHPLPEGVSEIVAKGEPLTPRVMALLPLF
jgi:CheY-like chemotaxis protein